MATDPCSEYEVIIVGGGTAAGVIAGRLAAADPNLRILVLEAGPHTKDQLIHTQPARYLAHLAPTSTTVKFYTGSPSDHLDGRQPVVPCGACLGGGSSVNFAMYTRASASDYDDWKSIYGNHGWGSDDLIPLLRKTESYQVAEGKPTHGYDGPLKVSYGGVFTSIGQEFLCVASAYDSNRPILEDLNTLTVGNGYGGTRSDVPHHFLYNQSHNNNLVIETGCLVRRVLFEYVPDLVTQDCKLVRVAHANRLVVVSSGTMGSPQVLERSGIGRKDVLDKVDVEQIVDLPGVGMAYQDHQVIFAPYLAPDTCDTLDGIVRSDEAELKRWDTIWEKDGKGLMAHNALDAGGKLRPTMAELKEIGPAFEKRWNAYFATDDHQDKPAYWIGAVALLVGDPSKSPYRKYFSVGYFIEYPSSMGHIHITSKDSVDAAPDFDPAYCSSQDDLDLLNFLYKKSREFARRMPSYRGEHPQGHPQFPEGSKAAVSDTGTPVPMDAPDIQYDERDEDAIRKYTRATVATAWHSLGTCAMKPREDGGVVDAELNVYGTECLKVADMSIAPGNVGANTYSTALVIGEKAALIIAEYLGIEGV
ncbi:alcohol oxidase-like protein [Punctularia strigosozonata HHB-11173 SS5]|uniref:alcohol oxidase-like protein n=1 Tax=Punctularia strigosozonata (strain HHB-11173) TaxID=741275 RepID=UPI0004417B2F|nr:alcohol oxidase-like protein [Punctularia strigosozonata HHB-11173 SS5]EIN11097.1 alcohol oxidase-like protein [Punctularia strigosozonata HHB-11173 SS5]